METGYGKIALIAMLSAVCVLFVIGIDSDDSDADIGSTFTIGDFNYTIISESPRQVEVTGPTSTSITSIDIPETVEYSEKIYTVTTIPKDAFKGCASATSITIPKYITSVNTTAFSGCSSVTTFTFNAKNYPDFNSSTHLTGFGAPAAMDVFFGPDVGAVPGYLLYSMSCVKTITFSSGVTSISKYAFNGCYNVTTMDFSDATNLIIIGNNAFEKITKITAVDLSNTKVTQIGEHSFDGCSALLSISFPSTLTSLGAYSFNDCAKMETADLTGTSLTEIGACAFYECYMLDNIVIPKTVTSIGGSAFYNCTHATNVSFLTNQYGGGDKDVFRALGKNSEGTTFTFGPEVTVIPSMILYGGNSYYQTINGVTTVVFQGSVTEIGSQAFCGCQHMASITLPNTLTTIGSSAFSGCSALQSIVIPENVTSIGSNAFYSCHNLAIIYYNATSVADFESGDAVFGFPSGSQASVNKTLVIGEGVQSIPAYFFAGQNRSGLKIVTISSTVKSIGAAAFSGVTSLNTISILGVPDSFGSNSFRLGTSQNARVTCTVNSIISGDFLSPYSDSYTTFNYNVLPHIHLDMSGKVPKSVPNGWAFHNGSLIKYYGQGDPITIPSIVVEGYTFTGWDRNPEETMGSDTQIYVSQWQIKTATITFDTGEGTPISPITADYGTPLNVTPPTRTGYTFVRWNPQLPTTMPESNHTYVAVWTIQKHTVTYVTNCDIVIGPAILEYGEVIQLPTIERTGYDFIEWSLAPAGATMGETDVVATAIWQIRTITLTFDTDGGLPVDPIVAEYDTPIEVPTTSRTGYIFEGWDPSVPDRMPGENVTYHAVWTIQKHTVTYVTNCDIVVDPVVLEYGKAIPLSPIERTGYDFIEWSLAPAGATMGETDVVATAIWQIRTITLTFNTGEGSPVEPMTAPYNTPISSPSSRLVGYILIGWNPDFPEYMPAQDTMYTANWQIQKHYVFYNTNGGTSVPSKELEYGQEIPLPTVTRIGYEFDKWSIEPGTKMGESDVVVSASWIPKKVTLRFNTMGGTSISPITVDVGSILPLITTTKTGYTISSWSPALPLVAPTTDTTYTANWTLSYHNVYFDTDGGSKVTSPISVGYGQEIPLPKKDPKLEGHKFAGWSIPAGTIMGDEDLTVTAKWVLNYYRVYYINEYDLPVFLQDYPYGKSLDELKKPVLKGYEFKGWKDAPETMPAEDLYITPIWMPAESDDSDDTNTSDKANNLPIYIGAGAGAVALVGVAALLLFRLRP